VPCGFTAAGLPVGVQIVGRPRGEHALLKAAAAFERAIDLGRLTPIDPRRG
jgi:amidase